MLPGCLDVHQPARKHACTCIHALAHRALVCVSMLAFHFRQAVVDQCFQLYPLKQPLLSKHTTEVLCALVGAPTAHLTPAQLADVLKVRGWECGGGVGGCGI